jgi:hypothetical protein
MPNRPTVETLPFLDAVKRMIRAAGRRVAEADEFELAELVAIRDELDEAIIAAIAGQRSYGRSWADIGDALGITRQAAQQRYSRPAELAAARIAGEVLI